MTNWKWEMKTQVTMLKTENSAVNKGFGDEVEEQCCKAQCATL